MAELVTLSIGIGLVISLVSSEMLGLTAGGMVVPGYIALYLNRPVMIILTLVIAYLTYFIIHSLSLVMIVYGRRRIVLMILVGFALGVLVRSFGSLELPKLTVELTIIGYIIPGLIAIWMDRQGLVESLSSLIIASVIVRMVLILITGGEIKI
jgi:poly-gamma-glutamate biosynthesis protein PgsC/CapC